MLYLRVHTEATRTHRWHHTGAGEADDACVHCGEPEGILHAIDKCPAFATTGAKFLPDLATSNNPMEAITAYIYLTGPKGNQRAWRDHLLAFLNKTDLA